MRPIRPFTVLSVLVLLAGLAAFLTLKPPPAGEAGQPAGTLVLLTGSTQLQRSGSSVSTVGRSGDQLRLGDRVSTGPGSRAVLDLASGDQVRLDAGTEVVLVSEAKLQQLAGRTMVRNLTHTSLTVQAGERLFSASGGATEFAVDSATMGEPEPGSPWLAINRVLDADPSPRGPAALGTGDLLPGEETSPQQAVTVPPAPAGSLVFTAGWTIGVLELVVLDPDGKIYDTASAEGQSRQLSLTVPAARAGGWGFRLRRTDPGATGQVPSTWFVAISPVSH